MKTMKRYGKRADLALTTWVKLARAHATVSHFTAEDIRSYGLTQAQFGALETLGHLGPMLIGELTRKQLVCAGNMTVVINNLEKEGLVDRAQNLKDRRAVVVKLTAKGKRLFDRIFVQHANCVSSLLSVLTEEEQLELGRILKKLGTSARPRS